MKKRAVVFQRLLLSALVALLAPCGALAAGPLRIAAHPQSVTKPEGGSHTFTVTAADGSGSYTYQWRRNGVSISGATSASLTLSNLQLTLSGNQYSVRVSDGISTITSANATLTVRARPTVSINTTTTTLLTSDSLTIGSNATAAPGGSIVSYEWLRNNANVGTGSTYAVSSVSLSHAGSYTLKVRDEIGGIKISDPIVIKITAKEPAVVESATMSNSSGGNFNAVDALENETITFSGRVRGNGPLTVRWYSPSRQASPIQTETFDNPPDAEHPNQALVATASFQFTPTRHDDLTRVYFTVSGYQSGGATRSEDALINVHYAPEIFTEPESGRSTNGTFAVFTCFLGYEEDDPLSNDGSVKTGRIAWYRNGVKITNGTKHTISENGDFSVLVVNNITASDSNAQYICRSLDLDWDSVYRDSAPATLAVNTTVNPDVPVCGDNHVSRGNICVPNGVPDAQSDSTDSDGDGFSDVLELEKGSSVTDAGSHPAVLNSPAYALWNGFLGMINILELVNPGLHNQTVTVSLFTISGELGFKQTLTLAPGSQQDIILNDVDGFSVDSYGLVTVQFDGAVDGRLFFYRPAPENPARYSFAFGLPLTNPTFGRAVVGFNTMQPSTNSDDLQNAVFNWLSIVNLASSAKSFQVSTFSADGELLKTDKVTIPGFGRLDLDGGHVVPGPFNVGAQEIIPYDASAPYIGQLIRYGATTPPHLPATDFDFAFPLVAKPGIGEVVHLPISNKFNALNWLEVANTLSHEISVDLEVRDSVGNLKHQQVLELLPFAQVHIFASAYLAPEELGTVRLVPNATGAIIAQSMYYFKDTANSISSMYGSQHQEALSSSVTGSYNLFLGMESYLRVTNPQSSTITIVKKINNQTALLAEHEITLAAHSSVEFPLHDRALFNTEPDTYGTVSLSTAEPDKLLAEVLRVRKSGTTLEYVAPTAVR